MTDVMVKVLEPADNISFLTVREAKLMLGLPPDDTAQDDLIEQQIEIASATIAELTNRTFAKEKVYETWRDFSHRRLWLTRFPVEDDDIEKITIGGNRTLSGDEYEIENKSGMLHFGVNTAIEPIRVTYSGGFVLPDDAPKPLKQATLLLVTQQRSQATRESIEGIRMIAHKDSRVLFFDPTQQAKSAGPSGGLGSGSKQVDDLLMHYVRHAI
jgi:hypothetical protein